MKRSPIYLLFCVQLLVLGSPGYAASEDPIMELYKSLEPVAAELWKRAQEVLAKEENKNLSPQKKNDADEGFRWAIYQRMYHVAKCMEKRTPFKSTSEFGQALVQCEKEAINQYQMISKITAYAATIPIEQQIKCEKQSRQFRDEVRFPPFEILQKEGMVLMLFDLKKLMACNLK